MNLHFKILLLERILIAIQIIYALGWNHMSSMDYGLWWLFYLRLSERDHNVVWVQESHIFNSHCSCEARSMNTHMFLRAIEHSPSEIQRKKNKNMTRTLQLLFCHGSMSRYTVYVCFHCLWFVFFQPLGASDYLEISKHFDTVFVRDIPLLTIAKRTQTRRFITLIDTFYEHKVRIEPFLFA